MSTIGRIATARQHTGDFKVDQQQRLAQQVAQKANTHADMLAALVNRSYSSLATDTSINAAAYATLLTANITTVLSAGYLIINFSASGVQVTNAATNSFQILVDGVVVRGCYVTAGINYSFNAAMVVRKAVTRGPHVVKLQWKTNVNAAHINPATVNEEHAHLLVQEAA